MQVCYIVKTFDKEIYKCDKMQEGKDIYMQENENTVKEKIYKLSDILYKAITYDNLTSFDVLNISKKIDELILEYYTK